MFTLQFGRDGRVPVRALLLSFAALAVPIAVAVLDPQAFDRYHALPWILAIVPALLLSYFQGRRGATIALGAAMVILALTELAIGLLGAEVPQWLLLTGVGGCITMTLGVAWGSELMHRRWVVQQPDALDVTIILDRDGRIRHASSSTNHILGRSASALVGSTIGEHVHPADRPRLEALLDEPVSSRDDPLVKLRFRHADESVRVFEVATRDLRLDPAVAGIVLDCRDVTKRTQLEEQLRGAHRMEAIGRLTGGLAHDFNNVLTVIRGHVALLLEDLDENAAARSDIEEIFNASEHATKLTRQLLAFSRQQVLQPTVIDLGGLVTDLDGILRRAVGDGIRLVTRLAEDGTHVRADPGQLEQVLINLAINASDAMPNGGDLIIGLEPAEIDEAFTERFVYTVRPGAYVKLTVADTGHGMEGETRERIFEPFFTTKESSTGLGLSTVYGTVKQSGGYIWVESEPGEGTRFSIYLPRVDATVDPTPAEPNGRAPMGSETVLLVEDDGTVRALVRRVLLRHGYRVLEASNGCDAMTIAADYGRSIDLLMTDVLMPEMGGRELAGRLLPLYPGARVLYMSGHTPEALFQQDLFADDVFIQKPFTPTEVARRVRETLRSPGTPQNADHG